MSSIDPQKRGKGSAIIVAVHSQPQSTQAAVLSVLDEYQLVPKSSIHSIFSEFFPEYSANAFLAASIEIGCDSSINFSDDVNEGYLDDA